MKTRVLNGWLYLGGDDPWSRARVRLDPPDRRSIEFHWVDSAGSGKTDKDGQYIPRDYGLRQVFASPPLRGRRVPPKDGLS